MSLALRTFWKFGGYVFTKFLSLLIHIDFKCCRAWRAEVWSFAQQQGSSKAVNQFEMRKPCSGNTFSRISRGNFLLWAKNRTISSWHGSDWTPVTVYKCIQQAPAEQQPATTHFCFSDPRLHHFVHLMGFLYRQSPKIPKYREIHRNSYSNHFQFSRSFFKLLKFDKQVSCLFTIFEEFTVNLSASMWSFLVSWQLAGRRSLVNPITSMSMQIAPGFATARGPYKVA